MAFADEIDKVSSGRFSLVRLEVSRWISTDLELISPGRYHLTNFPYEVKSISRTQDSLGGGFQPTPIDGLVLTPLTKLPDIDAVGSDNRWDQDLDGNNTVRMKISPFPLNEGENGTDIFYLTYYVFLSSNAQAVYFGIDPTDNNTKTVFWEPRLVNDPVLSQSSDDTVFANIKSSSTSIKIANQDNWFTDKFLSDDDSFHNKELNAWVVANDQVSKLFTAKSKALTVDKIVDLNLYDATTNLDSPATFGCARDDVFWSDNTNVGITLNSIDPEFDGDPIPLVIGQNSWHKTDSDTIVDITASAVSSNTYAYSRGQKAIGLNPNLSAPDDTNNRDFGICKVANGIRNVGGISIDARLDFSGFIKILRISGTDISKDYQIGDSFKWENAGDAGPSYGIVMNNTDFTYLSVDYNLLVWSDGNQNVMAGSGGTMQVSDFSFPTKSMGIICRSSAWQDTFFWKGQTLGYLPMMQGWDYNVTETVLETSITQSNGFSVPINMITITMVDGFETQGRTTMTRDFNPKQDSIEWRISTTSPRGHHDWVEFMSSNSGLNVNATSFNDVGTALSADLQMQIPNIGQSSIGSYRDYIGQICRSLGTYITINDSGQVEYNLLVAPSAGDEIATQDILGDRVIRKRVWKDIAAQFYTRNIHVVDKQGRLDSEATITSDKYRFLHESENNVNYTHVLVDGSISDRVHKILRNRSEIYQFDVSHRFITKQIGDDITLTCDETNNVAKNLKIIAISKSVDKVSITARDFGEL